MRTGIRIIAAVAIAACLSAAGCSRGGGAASFDGVFEKLRGAKGFDDAKLYYTGGTIDAIERAVSEGAVAKEGRMRVLPVFNERTSWEEVSRNVSGDRGTISIRYTGHPVENMIGVTMNFRMVREKGSWKIDLGDEMRDALGGKGAGAEDYIRRISKGY